MPVIQNKDRECFKRWFEKYVPMMDLTKRENMVDHIERCARELHLSKMVVKKLVNELDSKFYKRCSQPHLQQGRLGDGRYVQKEVHTSYATYTSKVEGLNDLTHTILQKFKGLDISQFPDEDWRSIKIPLRLPGEDLSKENRELLDLEDNPVFTNLEKEAVEKVEELTGKHIMLQCASRATATNLYDPGSGAAQGHRDDVVNGSVVFVLKQKGLEKLWVSLESVEQLKRTASVSEDFWHPVSILEGMGTVMVPHLSHEFRGVTSDQERLVIVFFF
jgi:hypothetical protein